MDKARYEAITKMILDWYKKNLAEDEEKASPELDMGLGLVDKKKICTDIGIKQKELTEWRKESIRRYNQPFDDIRATHPRHRK